MFLGGIDKQHGAVMILKMILKGVTESLRKIIFVSTAKIVKNQKF